VSSVEAVHETEIVVAVLAPTVRPVGAVGAQVSTRQVYEAGVPSALPAESVAATVKVCWPAASEAYACGEVHAVAAPPSRVHANVEGDSVDENEKDADVAFVAAGGCAAIDVEGGTVSTVHVKLAGVASEFPAWSVAATVNVWVPFASDV
jgi:hypothetical protein